jgi:hypothetical protein
MSLNILFSISFFWAFLFQTELPSVLQTPMTPIDLTTPVYAKDNPFIEKSNKS